MFVAVPNLLQVPVMKRFQAYPFITGVFLQISWKAYGLGPLHESSTFISTQ